MRKNLPIAFLCVAIFSYLPCRSQSDHFLYAITDMQKDGAGWNALRKMDTKTGVFSEVLLNGSDWGVLSYDAATKKPYKAIADARYGNYLQAPFSTGVAAAAYDKRNNRIWYTPMFIDQLRYIDLKTMQVFYVTDKPLTGLGNMQNDESKIITRMVITPTGEGYAVSNDGNTFIRFSTSRNIKIENLGSINDDPASNTFSIHDRNSSFGGDMIADNDGHLYIISARNHVFKVDIRHKTATHLASISGLPEGFTANGAVVNDEGRIILGSAVYADAWALIDPANWSASIFKPSSGVVRSSDLANSNYLDTRKGSNTMEIIQEIKAAPASISIYPNPVTHQSFILDLRTLETGDYQVVITDITGKLIQRKMISIAGNGQTEKFSLASNTAAGVYFVNVTDRKNLSVFTQKLIVQ
ncbi:MAG: T9SS type A sorting domain-containing protein [Terrimonas sp.]|nr:T9SS type A sorting domain-containing protein [Terrimonas sp.]